MEEPVDVVICATGMFHVDPAELWPDGALEAVTGPAEAAALIRKLHRNPTNLLRKLKLQPHLVIGLELPNPRYRGPGLLGPDFSPSPTVRSEITPWRNP